VVPRRQRMQRHKAVDTCHMTRGTTAIIVTGGEAEAGTGETSEWCVFLFVS